MYQFEKNACTFFPRALRTLTIDYAEYQITPPMEFRNWNVIIVLKVNISRIRDIRYGPNILYFDTLSYINLYIYNSPLKIYS